ncbi:hypothetical protein [Streptomyces sp. NPDC058295]|uniref:hypothetical protein n=1 Tax=Streptomyces sp. NPDC058295 TaxID=3346431 RepID=UPI0036EB1D8F
MTTSSPRPATVQPYPAGTQWTFSSHRTGYTKTEELVLYAEPNGASMSDDYLPEETSASELWRMWVDKYANYFHQKWPTAYRPGEVHIYWTVTQPTFNGTFEGAPHAVGTPPDPEMVALFGSSRESEHFLTHFTDPVHAVTGERLNWLRLPVLDRGWNETAAHKGGFIQEVTGWKPAPLQTTMDVVQVGKAAGVYVPPLG